jgi:glucose/mannose transport system substrate-binding protein
MTNYSGSLAAAIALVCAPVANAVELEVTHWWTSGGEAAAVAQFEEAFNKTGNTWVNSAIPGSIDVARNVIISRIIGGDPMAATNLNHGRQAEELIRAGLLLDLTDVAEAGRWREIVNPVSLLDACTIDGRVYCVPVNIHSWQWLWLSHAAFERAGLPVPKDWNEFVAAAPELNRAGILPLAMGQQGWQKNLAFNALTIGIAGTDAWREVAVNKNADAARGPAYAAVFEAAAAARELARNSKVQDWNEATNLVITGQAAGQLMGDWAQGEFQVAQQVAGKDYTCLPGVGLNEVLDTGGDAFYFPLQTDPEIQAAQIELAELLISPDVQVAFNLAKGSLPIRGDIDLSAANDCMKKGLEILAKRAILPSADMALSVDTQVQLEDLMTVFWSSDMTAAEAQGKYADIIEEAD